MGGSAVADAVGLKQRVDEGRGGGSAEKGDESEQQQCGKQRKQPEFFVRAEEEEKFPDHPGRRLPARLVKFLR